MDLDPRTIVPSPWENCFGSVMEGVPFTPSAPAALPVPRWSPGETPATQLLSATPDPVTILLVEDDEAARSGIDRFLSRIGYRVVQAPDGGSALHLASGVGPEVSLALIDIRLPDMLGDELWRRLNQKVMGLRTLFISGHPPQLLPTLPLHRQEVSFLAKPFDLTDLDQSISDLLATR